MGVIQQEIPNIFEYDDYRIFLADMIFCLKQSQPKEYTHRAIAQYMGFKSSSYFKSILNGDRNLKTSQTTKFCSLLQLNKRESRFFQELVDFNQATDSEDKAKRAQDILDDPEFRKTHPLAVAEAKAYSEWYYYPIRELVNHPEFQENSKWIANQLEPKISEIQARRAMSDLIELKLLIRDEHGQLKQSNAIVTTTPKSIVSSLAKKYHKQMLSRASESLDRFESHEREISATTMALSEHTYKEMKLEFLKFRERLHQLALKDNQADKVVQLNFQLFPLIRSEESDHGENS